MKPSINTTEHNSLPLCDDLGAQPSMHTHRHTHLRLALSLSKQPFYSERLQWSGSAPAKTPFHTSSPFSKPSLCVTAGPSFLPSSWHTGLGESQGSQDGRMCPDQKTQRRTDWQGTDMQTGRCCCYRGLWARLSSHPELEGDWHHSCFDRTTGRLGGGGVRDGGVCGWEHEAVWGNRRKRNSGSEKWQRYNHATGGVFDLRSAGDFDKAVIKGPAHLYAELPHFFFFTVVVAKITILSKCLSRTQSIKIIKHMYAPFIDVCNWISNVAKRPYNFVVVVCIQVWTSHKA